MYDIPNLQEKALPKNWNAIGRDCVAAGRCITCSESLYTRQTLLRTNFRIREKHIQEEVSRLYPTQVSHQQFIDK